MGIETGVDAVREFWGTAPCGTHEITEFSDRRDFFAKYREFRYRTAWWIPELIPFASAAGKDVLEIGCGNGADGVQFARHGARYTGVDLTQVAVDATREHFSLLGLEGRFQIENAERLSFPDRSFDIVYSLGVLHHTPGIRKAVAEVHRVLKPGGRAIIMLYYKRSFNYYVRIIGYMRARVVLYILARAGRWASDRARLLAGGMTGLRGNESPDVWDVHYRNFLAEGWSYLRSNTFVSHCTDGPECPLAYVFTKGEARELFSAFKTVDLKVAHLPFRHRLAAPVPLGIERALASVMGFNLLIYATK